MASIAHGSGSMAAGDRRTAATTATDVRDRAIAYTGAALRVGLGWIFLWAFLDKLFGLGHETASKSAWINGGHPTQGFLKFSAKGAFTGFYHSIAGAAWADWLFMLGLAGLAIALITGIGIRVAAVTGSVLLLMMWSVVLPPENNVFLDDHLIYIGVLVLLALTSAGDTLGFGRWWGRTALVKANPWLK